MKRLFSILLCLVMCFGCSLTAFAEGALPAETEFAANNTGNTVSPMAIPSGLMFGKVYTIKPKLSRDIDPLVLNVNNENNANGTPISLVQQNNSPGQKFRLISSSSGSKFKLLAMSSSDGKVLDAHRNTKKELFDGSPADIWDSDDNEAQEFEITGDSASGYSICLASGPKPDSENRLALTVDSIVDNGAVQFKTYSGSLRQKWEFIADNSFPSSKQPDPDAQNKTNWCWAAAAKMVGEHNGGVNSNILRYAKELEDEVGIHRDYYGLTAIARLSVDGVQRAIVVDAHRNDKNDGGSVDDVKQALQFASANNMNIEWFWDGRITGLTSDNITILNGDLIIGRYVVAYVQAPNTTIAHYIVLKKYDGVDTYTIFDPWNKKEFRATSAQLFGTYNDGSDKLPYADDYYGKMFGFYRCY